MIGVKNVVTDRYFPPLSIIISIEHTELFGNDFNHSRSIVS